MFPRPSSFVMASPVKVMLIACGSFNPVTNMHLRMFGKEFRFHLLCHVFQLISVQ